MVRLETNVSFCSCIFKLKLFTGVVPVLFTLVKDLRMSSTTDCYSAQSTGLHALFTLFSEAAFYQRSITASKMHVQCHFSLPKCCYNRSHSQLLLDMDNKCIITNEYCFVDASSISSLCLPSKQSSLS